MKRLSLFIALSLIITDTVFASGSRDSIEENPLNLNSKIEIYFTPSLDCENNIIKRINNAQKIDIAVYSINNVNIFNALLKA